MQRNRVLFVTDMLNDFLEPGGALYCGRRARKIIPYVDRKIREFRSKKYPVIFVCDAHRYGDYELKIYPPHAMKGTHGSKIVAGISRFKDDYIFEKRCYDGFSNPKLNKTLRKLKVKEVFIAGVCTSVCVMENVSRLFHLEIPVTVFKRGVADFDEKNHKAALKRMKEIFGAKII